MNKVIRPCAPQLVLRPETVGHGKGGHAGRLARAHVRGKGFKVFKRFSDCGVKTGMDDKVPAVVLHIYRRGLSEALTAAKGARKEHLDPVSHIAAYTVHRKRRLSQSLERVVPRSSY